MRRYSRYRTSNGTPTYYAYRTLHAKFASTCKCGTEIKPGDRIACTKGRPALCDHCWAVWTAEVQEEQMAEDAYNRKTGGW